MSNKPNPRKKGARATTTTARGSVPGRPSRATTGPSRALVLVLVGVVLVAVAIIAIVVAGGDDDDTTDTAGLPQTRPVEITGTPLPTYTGDGNDPAVGSPAPAVNGSSFDGSPVAIANDGRPKLVLFLAHWCPHCRAEVPRVVDWLEANGMPEGVDLYAVATGTTPDGPNYPPSQWLEREGWPAPTLADDENGSAARAFGLASYPYFVAIDANGNVVARASGELPMPAVENLIEAARGAA